MAARDDVVFDLADLLVPVSVRPAGSIAKRLAKCRLDGRSVIDRFEVPYDARGQRLKYTIGESLLNPVNDDLSHRYLIHWTRTSNGPWPDERPIDYYRSVLASPTYPRSALDTLLRILQTRRFIASGRHLPHNVRAVSFSDLPPRQVIRLMRWRARYREMSFEPYGLGVEISAARSLGIQPVIYYDPDVADVPLAEDRWRWQSAGAVGDWVKEGEYRHLGDLDFSRIPHDALLAFCCRPSEAPAITKASGIPCVPILAEDQATLR